MAKLISVWPFPSLWRPVYTHKGARAPKGASAAGKCSLQPDLTVTKSDQKHSVFRSIIEKGGAKFQHSLSYWFHAGRIWWGWGEVTADNLFGFLGTFQSHSYFEVRSTILKYYLTHILIHQKGLVRESFYWENLRQKELYLYSTLLKKKLLEMIYSNVLIRRK